MKRKLAFPFVAAADLAIDFFIMVMVSTLLFVLTVLGVSLVWLFGFGLLFFALCVPLVRFIGYEERRRAAVMYSIHIPDTPRALSTKAGWKRVPDQLWKDFRQASFWRTVGFIIASSLLAWIGVTAGFTLLGGGIGALLSSVVHSIAGSGEPLLYTYASIEIAAWVVPLIGIASVAVGVLVVVVYGVVDRIMARALLGATKADLLRVNVSDLSEARESAVNVAASDRMRVERDLHDGVQPRLVSVALTLGMAKNKVERDPDEARVLIDQAHSETKNAITELRQLARGIHPAILVDRGLDAALSALVARCAVPVSITVDLPARGTPEVEAVIYFSVAEALTNIDKHAHASQCWVQVRYVEGEARTSITDNGIGGARIQAGLGASGLAGIRDRVSAAGGSFSLTSPEGGPTTLNIEVPWRTSAAANTTVTEVL
ncbi:histidine kinase [Lysinibacter sp. HNR]|uniref:sensor histidine kinase n=1 Tax=Lysinibacter sp. HNR TaxID=3031408 RepID=UPI002435848D|nr:histidine kinase [Lysinibacter sp. HNR]WGD37006.1 histidine kinase [Lysinibacter sp. HNR]